MQSALADDLVLVLPSLAHYTTSPAVGGEPAVGGKPGVAGHPAGDAPAVGATLSIPKKVVKSNTMLTKVPGSFTISAVLACLPSCCEASEIIPYKSPDSQVIVVSTPIVIMIAVLATRGAVNTLLDVWRAWKWFMRRSGLTKRVAEKEVQTGV